MLSILMDVLLKQEDTDTTPDQMDNFFFSEKTTLDNWSGDN